MSTDLLGALRFWVFFVVLVALFSAALFRPDRIRQGARLWMAAGLLAFTLFLECVAPLFFSPSLGPAQTAGGAMRVDALASGMQAYLTAVKVIAVLQHGALAAALLLALSAFFDRTAASGERLPRRAEATPRPRTEETLQPAPRQRVKEEVPGFLPPPISPAQPAPRQPVKEDACLSCGQRIPPDAAKCPACGWTWGKDEATGGNV
jgi:hypothetical protein